MSACTYTTLAEATRTLSASHYAYWTFRESSKGAKLWRKVFEDNPLQTVGVCREATQRPFFLDLLLITLGGATYNAFGADQPFALKKIDGETYIQTTQEMATGRSDALAEILTPAGDRLNAAQQEEVRRMYGELVQGMANDFQASLNGVRTSKCAAAFITLLTKGYRMSVSYSEETLLQEAISDIATEMLAEAEKNFSVNYLSPTATKAVP